MSQANDPADLFRRPATRLGADLRAGAVSARDLLEHYLARIQRLNPVLNAFVYVNPTAAAEADASDALLRAGRPRGPLEGIPVAVKDSLWVKDMPATWGSPLYAGHIAPTDEQTVAKIRAAGAVMLGKTNCPEFAMRGVTDNALFGATANPFDPRLTPGGSSGGAAAAVAAGLAPLALATDGGGSIRRPAAHTGLVGLKPSVARVRRGRGFPQLTFDFEVIGPMARDVSSTRLFFHAMAEPAAASVRPGKLRVLYVDRFGDAPVDPAIAVRCAKAADAIARLGHEVRHGALPFSVETAVTAWSEVGAVGLARLTQSESHFFEQAAADFAEQARKGLALSAAQYAGMIERLLDFRVAASSAFDRLDIIMTPATAAQPWSLTESYPPLIAGQKVGPRGHAVFTAWVNAAGLPALALPAEPDEQGLPIGFQLIGAPGADELLLEVGAAYETAFGPARWPELATQA